LMSANETSKQYHAKEKMKKEPGEQLLFDMHT
jgi:hypothetical protein